MSHIAHKRTNLTLEAIRLFSFVTKDDCWQWMKAFDPYGYAVYGKGFHVRVARFAWEKKNNKEMEDRLLACHICDHSWCVNPDHIYAGTASSNIRDQYRAFNRRGMRLIQSLSNNDVGIIKARIHESARSLSKEYKVSHATINKIRNGERYLDIEPDLQGARELISLNKNPVEEKA